MVRSASERAVNDKWQAVPRVPLGFVLTELEREVNTVHQLYSIKTTVVTKTIKWDQATRSTFSCSRTPQNGPESE